MKLKESRAQFKVSPTVTGRAPAASAVKMKSAQFSGVSRVVVVQPSATLFSVYQHRLSGSSAMEREVSYYINIQRDSARAEQSAKDSAVEVRHREAIDQTAARWSGRERVRDELSNM